MNSDIAIVGGGASGALLATHLAGEGTASSVTIFEPDELGLGVAYSTTCALHVLNVRSGAMSAFPEMPDHFTRWLASKEQDASPDRFAPRRTYGRYLQSIAREALARADGRIRHHRRRIVRAEIRDHGVILVDDRGESHVAGRCVLAVGPVSSTAVLPLNDSRVFASPWEAGALDPVDDGTIVLAGSGLTAVDAIVGLYDNGFDGRVYVVSRHGLFPHEHRPLSQPQTPTSVPRTIREAVRTIRSSDGAWRASIDALRPFTNDFWMRLPVEERTRAMRHVATIWNIHRHRMAPAVAHIVGTLIANGSVSIAKGRVQTIRPHAHFLRVHVKGRGGHVDRVIDADRAIDCTGPSFDIKKTRNPLLRSLFERGYISESKHGAGIETSVDGAVITSAGEVSERVFAIGPARFGSIVETTAMPEIRVQARDLAITLTKKARAVPHC